MQYGGFGAGAYRYPGHKSVRIRLGQISATHAVRGLSLNLSDVYVFKKVASTLSFTKAARQIGVSRSAVSKQVSRLEQDLGVVLINRTTRSVNLTEAGRTFDSNTSDIDTTIERAANLVRGADLSPHGTVSFALPSALGAALLPTLTTQFRARWPELRLHMRFDDSVQDMVATNLDLAIRISKRLTDSSLISRRLITTRRVFAASPAYLRDYGMPSGPSELSRHRCIGIASAAKTSGTWTFIEDGRKVNADTSYSISTNNHLALIFAACLGSGIIAIPEICIAGELAREQLQLIPSLVDPVTLGVYALYPHRNAAAKVKVLVEFIEKMLPKVLDGDLWSPLTDRLNATRASNDDADRQARKKAN